MNLSKTKLMLFSGLSSRKQRAKTGLFTAEGAKCVEDTLPFFEAAAIVASPQWLERNPEMSDKAECFEGNADVMRQISQLQTLPEVIAVYHIPELKSPDKGDVRSSLTLLLDSVQDPGNLGTIIRTASWFGVEHIVLGVGCVDPFNPKTVQSSMGAIGMVGMSQCDLIQFISEYPDIPLYGTLLDGKDIYTLHLELPAFVAMGNEGNGLSEAVRERVSHPLLIPSFAPGPHAESLNVAAATAVTLSEFRRQTSRKI